MSPRALVSSLDSIIESAVSRARSSSYIELIICLLTVALDGYGLVMPKPKQKKGNRKNKNINPLMREYGPSGLAGFIEHHKELMNESVSKAIILEPNEWLGYACVGVSEESNGTYRLIYDLNLIEHAYALMYAYEEFGYDSIERLMNEATDEQYDMAQEWVSYNTLRASPYMGPNAPLFIRTHDPKDWQSSAKWCRDW